MDILLTHGYFLHEDAKEQAIMKPYPPLGILYISSYLKKNQVECAVYDTTFSTKSHLYAFLLQVKPRLIGMYTNLMTKINVLQIIRFIKENEELKNCVIVLGGPEITNNVDNFLASGADILVIGEGEETMLELSLAYKNSSSPCLENISGIAYQDKDGTTIQTTEREKRKDLDELPWPDREAIDLQLYLDAWKSRHGKNAISISTMRGCPYTCKWCSRAVYGLSYRRRSPEQVADEVLFLRDRYQPDTLWFVDDVFTISHKWLRAFSKALQERQCQIPYECISRSDRMNEEVIQLLKESGCYRVWIGAESGSQRVIDAMDRRVDVKQVQDMILMTRRNGIEAGTFIMLGYPGETEEDIEDTIRHLKISQPDFYTITLAYPIKGTEMYQEVEHDLHPSPDWKSSTDRELEYPRTYSKRYYHHALSRVHNEVAFHRFKKDFLKTPFKVAKLKMKSSYSKWAMHYHRLF